jgi:hypothetical protein
MLRLVNDIVHEENLAWATEIDRDLFLFVMASTFYKVGIEPYTMEEKSIPGMAAAEMKLG